MKHTCKVSFNNKKGYIAVTLYYRSPSQNQLEFDTFISNFEKMLGDIDSDFSIILGNFNTTSYGFSQSISELTHILRNSSSCIDLIFTDQPSLIIDSGSHPSLHPNGHHKIIHCKINLKITYPPPSRRLLWNFKRANISSIKRVIKMVDWRFMFLNKNVHEQVSIFSNTLLTYWSILKSFYNDTKVPLIPPLLVNKKIASDFTKKANLFNDFFATQSTPLTNSSVFTSTISFKTNSRLNSNYR